MKTILNFVYIHLCKPNQKIEKKMTIGLIDFSLSSSILNAKGLGARSEGVMFSEWAQCNIIVRRDKIENNKQLRYI